MTRQWGDTVLRDPGRRRAIRTGVSWLGWSVLAACARPTAPLRVGLHTWPGYELLALGRALGALDDRSVRLVETPSASASLRGMRSGALDAACLTLDEVLTLIDGGLAATVVAVLDVSQGADVLMASADIPTLAALRGRRIGVENSAVGAVMLDAILEQAGLGMDQIAVQFVTIDQQEALLTQGRLDAVVTYEPVRTRLARAGYRELFTSREIPGRILDVLAVRTDALAVQERAIRACVQAHFAGLRAWQEAPERHRDFLAGRLGVAPDEVASAFDGMLLADLGKNRSWMAQGAPYLIQVTQRLVAVMRRAGLLQTEPPLQGLFDARFLD